MADTPRPTDSRDDFYVGYLPLPRRHGRALRVIVPVTLWLAAILAGLAAIGQRSPGGAIWSTGHATVINGTLFTFPYPFLLPEGGSPVFLVEVGKRGSAQRTAPMHGTLVAAKGWTLERDGRRILELVPESDALLPAHGVPAAAPRFITGGAGTLRGEIVDYKCYLGAMKPGEGKTHKACATLCISSGIPPMVVSLAADGSPRYHLLLDPDGGPATGARLSRPGEPVLVTGELGDLGGQPAIRASGIDAAK